MQKTKDSRDSAVRIGTHLNNNNNTNFQKDGLSTQTRECSFSRGGEALQSALVGLLQVIEPIVRTHEKLACELLLSLKSPYFLSEFPEFRLFI